MRPRTALSRKAPGFVRDFAVLAGGQFTTKLIGFVVFAVLARRLDPANYGAVEYIVGFAAFMAMAIDCGLGTIGVRRIAAAKSELPTLAALIPLARVLLALIAIPALIVATEFLGPSGLPSGLVWAYALSLLFVATNQEWLLQGAGLMPQIAIAQLLRMLAFAAMVLLLVHRPSDATYVGLAELVAVAVAALYYVWVQHVRVTPIRISTTVGSAIRLIRESASLGLSQFAWAAAQFMPLFLLGNTGNAAAIAWFAAAQRLVTSLSTFSYVYHFNLYPVLARTSVTSASAFADLMRASFRVTAWLSIGGALAIALTAVPLLTTIFGAPYAAAAPALSVLVWVVPVTILSGHARWSLIVAGDHAKVFGAQLVGLAIVALTGIPLVTYLHEEGAAWAAVAGSIAVWMVSHMLAARAKGPPPGIGLASRPIVVALIAGAAVEFAIGDAMWFTAGAIVFYVAAAPLVDRALIGDFIRLSRAKSVVASTPSADRPE